MDIGNLKPVPGPEVVAAVESNFKETKDFDLLRMIAQCHYQCADSALNDNLAFKELFRRVISHEQYMRKRERMF